MTLEKNIQDVITQQLSDGLIEKLIAEELEKGVKKALEHLFGSYGDLTKLIEEEVKSVMVPYLSQYDYGNYIIKLDAVLKEVLEHTTPDNKKILENFKELMIPCEEKTIKVSDLYQKWMEYVADNVETDGLEVCYDDSISYENVEVTLVVEHNEDRDWSSFKNAQIVFECEHDESLNIMIPISYYTGRNNNEWDLEYKSTHEMNALRNLNKFEVFLMKLTQNYTKVILDEEYSDDEVTPNDEPEATFS